MAPTPESSASNTPESRSFFKQLESVSGQFEKTSTSFLALVGLVTSLLANLLPNNPNVAQLSLLIGLVIFGILIVFVWIGIRKVPAGGQSTPAETEGGQEATAAVSEGSPQRGAALNRLKGLRRPLTLLGFLASGFLLGIGTWNFLHTSGYWTMADLSSCVTGESKPAVDALALANVKEGKLYVSVEKDLTTGVICQSTDGGSSWQPVTLPANGDVFYTAFAVGSDGQVFTADTAGNFYSLGATPTILGSWAQAADSPFPTEIVIDPNNRHVIYLLDTGGFALYQSLDEGKNWQQIKLETGASTSKISGFALVEQVLFASTDDGQILVSPNQGQTWNPASISGLSGNYISNIVNDPINQDTLYATATNGFFRVKFTPVAGVATAQAFPLISQLEGAIGNYVKFDLSNSTILYANVVNGGTYIVRNDKVEIIPITTDFDAVQSLYVTSLIGMMDSAAKFDGNALYVGTGGGLYSWKPSIITSLKLR